MVHNNMAYVGRADSSVCFFSGAFAISGMDMADCRSGTFNICNNGNIPQDFQKDRDQGIIKEMESV